MGQGDRKASSSPSPEAGRTFTVCLTHDVDRVRKTYQYLSHFAKELRHGRFARAFYHVASIFGDEPYWNFERIKDIESSYGVRSTWFFLHETFPFQLFSPRSWPLSLGCYSLDDPDVRRAVVELDRGGWEIGLHGSYLSYRDGDLLRAEKKKLDEVLGRPVVGVRQHYLNLTIPDTWRSQRECGLAYDASLGIRGAVGFPHDCYVPFVDPGSGMTVLPLAIMDKYLFETSGSVEEAWERCLAVIEEAQEKGACMGVLWHQRVFNEREFPGYSTVYRRIIEECLERGARFRLCKEVYEQYKGNTGAKVLLDNSRVLSERPARS